MIDYGKIKNPLVLGKILWPQFMLYNKQREIIESVWNNDETFVPAGNMLGRCPAL